MCQSAADGSIAVTWTLRLTDRGKTLYIYIKEKGVHRFQVSMSMRVKGHDLITIVIEDVCYELTTKGPSKI